MPLLRVKNWKIPEAELLHRLRSLHQQAQQSSSSSSGEQEQEQDGELTRKGRPKKNKEALFTRIGFKSTTMEQIQAIFFFFKGLVARCHSFNLLNGADPGNVFFFFKGLVARCHSFNLFNKADPGNLFFFKVWWHAASLLIYLMEQIQAIFFFLRFGGTLQVF
jgi:hypothetical protein